MDHLADLTCPVASVLDRLIGAGTDPAGSTITNLRRDVEWLLNSRRNVRAEGAEVAPQGVVDWGLPDLCDTDLARDADRQRVARWIASALASFEPRLRHVAVVADASADRPGRARFRVEATLDLHHAPREVVFDTVVCWPDRHIALRETST